MFDKLEYTDQHDAILALTEKFYKDPRINKINLGIGVYTNEIGHTPILKSVKQAEKFLLEKENSKTYLSIEGMSNFDTYTQFLLFGNQNIFFEEKRIRTIQTPGGTSALRIAADLLATQTKNQRIWISRPSWPNHRNIFIVSGLEVLEYPWYDSDTHTLSFEKLLLFFKNQVNEGDVVLFHSCCHNPTGIDPNREQWKELALWCKKKNLLPLFDCSYQGLDKNIEEDVIGMQIFAHYNEELLVASSYSKNMGLYNERVGGLTLITHNTNIADRVMNKLKAIIRTHYSTPPAHGAAIVTTILKNDHLKNIWKNELLVMRNRIKNMRNLFVSYLKKKGIKQDFSFISKQHGMFSYSGLSLQQVIYLRTKFGIYILNNGRLNIASMTPINMNILCNAIASVVSQKE
ncbi:MAG: amino acid aminotransferase [Candidatus Dasytiphilus stammeri]